MLISIWYPSLCLSKSERSNSLGNNYLLSPFGYSNRSGRRTAKAEAAPSKTLPGGLGTDVFLMCDEYNTQRDTAALHPPLHLPALQSETLGGIKINKYINKNTSEVMHIFKLNDTYPSLQPRDSTSADIEINYYRKHWLCSVKSCVLSKNIQT